jgi:hypothetical protein
MMTQLAAGMLGGARKAVGFGMILAALSAPAWAFHTPEIDPGSMAGALTLLTGGFLILTGRKPRR